MKRYHAHEAFTAHGQLRDPDHTRHLNALLTALLAEADSCISMPA